VPLPIVRGGFSTATAGPRLTYKVIIQRIDLLYNYRYLIIETRYTDNKRLITDIDIDK